MTFKERRWNKEGTMLRKSFAKIWETQSFFFFFFFCNFRKNLITDIQKKLWVLFPCFIQEWKLRNFTTQWKTLRHWLNSSLSSCPTIRFNGHKLLGFRTRLQMFWFFKILAPWFRSRFKTTLVTMIVTINRQIFFKTCFLCDEF